ncbi:MAG: type VI secretion system ATPase TssH [Cocleimonas sp.]|nr:type VI secretion system ATPase TssH [Cocleimonas sp.]
MVSIDRKALFGKLNKLCYESIEGAFKFCTMRGNSHIEIAHWLHQIFQQQDSDLHRLIKHFGIDETRLSKDLLEALDKLPSGASSSPNISSHIEDAVERAWVYGSLLFNDTKVRSAYLILGMLETKSLHDSLIRISGEFKKIKTEEMSNNCSGICSNSPESGMVATATGASTDADSDAPKSDRALDNYATNLTEKARNGEIDPVVGRDEEIRQIIDILMRRRQNNPILTGEAGVGKTAVVEGFANRIIKGDVPPSLKNVELYTLDMGLLQAGASMKGQFEERLKQVIDEIQASEIPIVMFIDEAHTLIGAGGAQGTGDAANLLKPALARGTLRTVAATTWAEYKKYFEKDPALTRRFQVVQIDEPDEEKAIQMMRCLGGVMEKHHEVLVLDEALEASVKLSHRYIPARQLPDKSISVLDTACARVAISQHATPGTVEYHQKRLEMLEMEQGIVIKEDALGIDTQDRLEELKESIIEEEKLLAELDIRWQQEKELVEKILEIRTKLHKNIVDTKENDSSAKDDIDETEEAPKVEVDISLETPPKEADAEEISEGSDKNTEDESTNAATEAEDDTPIDVEALKAEFTKLQEELIELQGDTPLVMPTVNESAVASVVADWTGIPVGRMVKNEIASILQLGETLGQRVLGQQHGLDMIAKRIKTSRAGLDSPDKPIGVFMLAGPSGVGKTETALALAEALYGGEESLITINMSEFQESHSVSTLKGSPPGYVGYGEGGILTEAVRRRPYSVVLLDEIEKAHPDVHEIFFQVFDKGWMEDAEGRYIDFRNTVILLTSNVGTEVILNACNGKEEQPSPDDLAAQMKPHLLNVFPAALIGRLVTIPYYPIDPELLKYIIMLKLGHIKKRVEEKYQIPFTLDEDVVQVIADRCNDVDSGARVVDSILSNTLLPTISQRFLEKMVEGEQPLGIHIAVKDGQFEYQFS